RRLTRCPAFRAVPPLFCKVNVVMLAHGLQDLEKPGLADSKLKSAVKAVLGRSAMQAHEDLMRWPHLNIRMVRLARIARALRGWRPSVLLLNTTADSGTGSCAPAPWLATKRATVTPLPSAPGRNR